MHAPGLPAALDPAAEADAICDEVNTLAMLFKYPERFHETKDLVARRLRRLARTLRGEGRKKDHVWRAPGQAEKFAKAGAQLQGRAAPTGLRPRPR